MLRQRGYSTWILKSALINPKIFIVCGDRQSRLYMHRKFRDYLRELRTITPDGGLDPIYIEWPKFITMNRVEFEIIGVDRFIPVIFDNSCFYG